MNSDYKNKRLDEESGDAVAGDVRFSFRKCAWLVGCSLFWLLHGLPITELSSIFIFMLLTAFFLCFGHSLGMHRLHIHNGYQTYYPVRIFLIHLGTVVGICGPLSMLRTHDIRDWAQRQKYCHPFFSHSESLVKDGFWQLFCEIQLQNEPLFYVEPSIRNDKWILWMEKYWLWQQLPWAMLCYIFGGVEWVAWGVALRVVVSNVGHWLIGYFAHNSGHRHYDIQGACVQGYNIRWASLLTFGECFHNNHHAFPGSAKLSLARGEWDIGWWCLRMMNSLRLVWDLNTQKHLPSRSELISLNKN